MDEFIERLEILLSDEFLESSLEEASALERQNSGEKECTLEGRIPYTVYKYPTASKPKEIKWMPMKGLETKTKRKKSKGLSPSSSWTKLVEFSNSKSSEIMFKR